MSASQALLCSWSGPLCVADKTLASTDIDTKLCHLFMHFSQRNKLMSGGCKFHHSLSLISSLSSISYWFLNSHDNEPIFLVFLACVSSGWGFPMHILSLFWSLLYLLFSAKCLCDPQILHSRCPTSTVHFSLSPRLCSLKHIRASLSKLKSFWNFPKLCSCKKQLMTTLINAG